MLLGIKEGGNGMASNADEIMVASQLFNSTVIRVYQDELLDTLEEVLELNGEVPALMMVTSQPIEFTDDDQEGAKAAKKTDEVSEKETKKEDKKAEQNLSVNFNPEEQVDWLTYLNKKGETNEELEGYELISSTIDDGEEEGEDWEKLISDSISLELSSAPADKRSKASIQDTDFIKVRYAYVQGSKKHGSSNGKSKRRFCTAMESASRLYRKEDILRMQADGVNSELGHNKAPYSLWKHKGGVNCHHKWERRIYVKRTKADGTPWGGSAMNGVKKATAKTARAKGFNKEKGKFRNEKRVAEAQIDRQDKGHHPSYRGKKK
jgi:hypothetical protein